MKIFYDGVIFTRQHHGGISRIYEHLQSQLPNVAPSADVHGFRFPSSLSAHPFLRRTHYAIPNVEGVLRWLDGYVFLPRAVRSYDPDVFHTSYYRLPEQLDSATVVSVYDMIHERFPGTMNDSERMTAKKQDCVTHADHIIAISDCTKRDLVKFFDVPEEKITVTHLAASPYFRPADDEAVATMQERFEIDEQFLLYVGRRAGYKNFRTLLQAYCDWSYSGEIPLICVGGESEWNEEESALIEREDLSDSIRHLDQIDDQQLRTLYTAATAFVYPSLYEGFGIPPLEAMQCGTPVIVSDVASIPEVVGDAGIYIDPEDETDIRSALTTVVTDPDQREAFVESGFDRSEKFNWESTTRETYRVYKNIT